MHRAEGVLYAGEYDGKAVSPRDFDGLLGCFYSNPLARQVAEAGVPAVNLSSAVGGIGLPWVLVDNVRVGRMAAEHFLKPGFRHYAYIGYSQRLLSRERLEGFRDTLAERGQEVIEYDMGDAEPLELPVFLERLPKPVAVFCANDVAGERVLSACESVGLAVPEQVAVLGVDDDESICGF